MALSGSSTYDEAVVEYLTNAGWHETNDLAKARLFITACRHLLLRAPSRSQHGDEHAEFDRTLIQAELDRAKAFVDSSSGVSDGGSGVYHADLSGYR